MKHSTRWMTVAVSALCVLVLSGSAAALVPGDLDPSFGVGGKVTTHFAHQSWVQALVVQPDGKLVVAGADMLARYDSGGTLDTTFGSGGAVATDGIEVGAAVLQQDSKIVVAGRGSGPGGMDFALLRYNANGTLDTTFGAGGMVTTDFAAKSDWARSLVLQPDGKIVAAGRASSPGDFGLVRYNPDGTLDTSFGSGGKVTTDFGSDDFAYALVRQQDGKLVAGGKCKLARYNLDGSLDSTFGSGGKVGTLFDGCYDTPLAIQTDGKLLTTGFNTVFPTYVFGVARYNSDGTLDTTFGSGGKLTSEFEVLALLNQPDGKLVTAGRSVWPAVNFSIARYGPNGTPDPSFGNGQIVTTDFFGGEDWANALAYLPNGNLVAAGQAGTSPSPSYGPFDFALVRYLGVVPIDLTPPVLTVPDPISTNATRPEGAQVSFAVTATDNSGTAPDVSCTPPSGSWFAIGTTTVNCTATDASNNSANAGFTVHIKGAAEQLADLGNAVQGVGPGTSLRDKVKNAQAELGRNNVPGTCSVLGAFINEVKAQSGKKIPPAQATKLVADATRIKTVLGC